MVVQFSPSPLLRIGQGGSGLPLAPWALLLAWWSPQLETNSKRLLLRAEGWFDLKRPCVHTALATHPYPAREGPT